MNRLLLLVALVLCAAAPASAATGIFKTFVILDTGTGNTLYGGGGATAPFFQTTYFAPTAAAGTFTLKGAQIFTFKNGGGNVTGASLFYRTYAQGAIPGAVFTQLPLGFGENLPAAGDQRWETSNAAIDLKAAPCGTGKVCTLEFYFQAFTSEGDRFDSNNSANFSRPFGVAPFANPVRDLAGFRLLSTPNTGTTVGTLAGINLVQGVPAGSGNTQQQYPAGAPNLFTTYVGDTGGFGGYARAADTGTAIPPGRGFFWQWYDQVIVPDPTSFGGGTSTSRELSAFTLPAAGPFETASVTSLGGFVANGTAGVSSGFHMIGNPFAYPLRANGISSSQGLQTTFQAWKPTTAAGAGTFEAISGTQALERWQGVLAEIGTPSGTAPTFSFDILVTTAQAVVAATYREARVSEVRFTLTGATASGSQTVDEAAVARFLPTARDGWDSGDASKLVPPTGIHALVALGMDRSGSPYRTAVNALPDDGAARTVPVSFLATDAGDYSLAWSGAADLPAGWRAELRDIVTGAVLDLRTAPSYTFSSAATGWTSRFELVVGRTATADEGAAPAEALRVLAPRPNPARGVAAVQVELGEAQDIRAALYDALGRRVLDLHDGAAPAGPLALRLDVSALAPGVYVVRVEGARTVRTQTITVVR